MSVIAATATRSSPGVTSLVVGLGLAMNRRHQRPLLVEADPAGGVLGLRFDLSAARSLQTLGADMRRGFTADLVHRNVTELQGMPCLLAPTDPVLATRTLERTASVLADGLADFDSPVVVDLGRIADLAPTLPLAQGADRVLVVTRPRIDDVQSLMYGVRLLRARGCSVSLVVVGDQPHHPGEIADLVDVPLAAVIPDDPAVAGAFSGGRYSARKLQRTVLWRAVDSLAAQLLADVPTEVAV